MHTFFIHIHRYICMLNISVVIFQQPQSLLYVYPGLSLSDWSTLLFLVIKKNYMGTNSIVFSKLFRETVGGFDMWPEKYYLLMKQETSSRIEL